MQGPGGIVAASCDAAISLAVNEINAGAGLLGREICTTNIDHENVLLTGGPEANHNCYVASSFFVDPRSDDGRDRLTRYRRLHGTFAPALTSFSNMSYEAIHTLRAIGEPVGALDVPDVHAALDQCVQLETPGGFRRFIGNQAQQYGYIALADDVDFDINARIT